MKFWNKIYHFLLVVSKLDSCLRAKGFKYKTRHSLFYSSSGLIHYIILNLNVSASKQDIKILFGRFWATSMMIIPAKFQPFIFKTVRGDSGEGRTMHGRNTIFGANRNEILHSPLALLRRDE